MLPASEWKQTVSTFFRRRLAASGLQWGTCTAWEHGAVLPVSYAALRWATCLAITGIFAMQFPETRHVFMLVKCKTIRASVGYTESLNGFLGS